MTKKEGDSVKVGILSFPNSASYGATLQMFALYHTVEKLGHEPEIINYFSPYMRAGKHTSRDGTVSVRFALKILASRILHDKVFRAFVAFEKRNMVLFPKNAVTDKSRLPEIGNRYGAVITGSDQVWNPYITNFDMSYFLDFCSSETKRISYAPSFGIEKFPEGFCDMIRSDIEKFKAVSVREMSGKGMLSEEMGIEPSVVLDPTMLVPAEQWAKLASNKKCGKGDYVLCFAVRSSKTLIEKCREIALQEGLRVVVIGGNVIKKIKNRDPLIEYCCDISPEEWLGLMHNARYVMTNSFHGTAFSIIFRKDFYLELSSRTNSRMSHLVSALGLEDRMVDRDSSIVPTSIDYSVAEERLSELSASSLEYLKNSLCEVELDG